jgi:molecular chaperone HscB
MPDAASMTRCAHCGAETGNPAFCEGCQRLLEIPSAATPFEMLGLPVDFAVDPEDVRRRLLKITRAIHPDFFGTESARVRALAESNSARLNEAWSIVSDDVARADWLVRHLGGPDEQTERAMPQAFLAEVLEWNETLEDARANPAASAPALEALARDLTSRRAESLRALAQILTPLPAPGSPQLKRARTELNAVRYVDRALSEIESLRLAAARK